MFASLEAFSFLSLSLLLPHESSESWTAAGCDAVLAAVLTAAELCSLPTTPFCHGNNVSECIVDCHFSHEIQWLMPFTQPESQYWCKALSALCYCSISSDCLFSEECTQAEQLGVGTVLIESELNVCCWRTDGSDLHSVVIAVWMIISCTCFSRQRGNTRKADPQQAVQHTVKAVTLVTLFPQQKYVLAHVAEWAC